MTTTLASLSTDYCIWRGFGGQPGNRSRAGACPPPRRVAAKELAITNSLKSATLRGGGRAMPPARGYNSQGRVNRRPALNPPTDMENPIMALRVDTSQKAADAFTVSLAGSLDNSTYQLLDAKLKPLLEKDVYLLIFDMGGLEYLSSVGVRSILQARNAVQKNDGKVVFMNLQPQIQTVFDIIKAIPSMQIFADVEELDAYLDAIQKQVTDEEN
jgi:anti-anti-sigma factor